MSSGRAQLNLGRAVSNGTPQLHCKSQVGRPSPETLLGAVSPQHAGYSLNRRDTK